VHGVQVEPAELAPPSALSISRATDSARSSSRCHVIPRSNPLSASATAVARPIPVLPPVTIAAGIAG